MFSFVEYEKYIRYLKTLSYIGTLEDYFDNPRPMIILRHDVDYSMEMAHTLSKLEKEAECISSYFIMLTSKLYNPLSFESRLIIREMADEGFEIGLHFDPVFDKNEREMEKRLRSEIDILNDICGREVKSISLHNPSAHNMLPMFKNLRNAYDPAIFGDDRYLSDSCMSFRGKSPYDFPAWVIKNGKPCQILLHPFLYQGKENSSYKHLLNRFVSASLDDFHDTLKISPQYGRETEGKKPENRLVWI